MKARIHLLEHKSADSMFIKNLSKDGEPIYVRYNQIKDKLTIPCDFLLVHKSKNLKKGDACLIHYKFENLYVIDKLKEVVKMSDIDSNLRDVFIGELGSVCPLDDVEKVMCSTFYLFGLYEMSSDFIAKCIFNQNTGDPIKYVEVLTIGKEEINQKLINSKYNYFDLSTENTDELFDEINLYKETPLLDKNNCVKIIIL